MFVKKCLRASNNSSSYQHCRIAFLRLRWKDLTTFKLLHRKVCITKFTLEVDRIDSKSGLSKSG